MAIDDGSGGAGFAFTSLTALHIKRVMNAIERAVVAPQVEIVVHPISVVVSLFDTWALDETAGLSKGNERRTAALRQLFADAGPEGVLRLATEAKVPYLIIEAIDSGRFSEPQVAELLSLSFDRDPVSSFTLGLSGLYRKVAGAERAEAWLRKVVDERGAAVAVVGKLFQGWPDKL